MWRVTFRLSNIECWYSGKAGVTRYVHVSGKVRQGSSRGCSWKPSIIAGRVCGLLSHRIFPVELRGHFRLAPLQGSPGEGTWNWTVTACLLDLLCLFLSGGNGEPAAPLVSHGVHRGNGVWEELTGVGFPSAWRIGKHCGSSGCPSLLVCFLLKAFSQVNLLHTLLYPLIFVDSSNALRPEMTGKETWPGK